jgi:predicted amidohydrolase
MSTLRVGLCLDQDAAADPASRRQLAGSDVLLFPEMVDSGYAALKDGAAPHVPGDALFRQFADLSRTLAPWCIGGSVYFRNPPPSTSNTSLVFHQGRLVHRYDKIHLFRPAGDHRWFRPGSRIATFRARVGGHAVRCGVIICYDLRFPELVRALAVLGLDVLFVPARWPAVRDGVWRTLLRARAMENQIFVVGCNARGPEGGASYVVDPLGEIIFADRNTRGPRVHRVTLDLGCIAEAQKLHRNLDEAVVLRSTRMPRRVTARRRPAGRNASRK